MNNSEIYKAIKKDEDLIPHPFFALKQNRFLICAMNWKTYGTGNKNGIHFYFLFKTLK